MAATKSATTAGAIKALVEGAGLGLAVYRDAAPRGAALPYVTVREAIALVPDLDGRWDPDVAHTVAETVSVDLWQRWRDPVTHRPVEDYTLPERLAQVLRATTLPAAPTRVYGVHVQGVARLLEDEANVVHHGLTVQVRRTLSGG